MINSLNILSVFGVQIALWIFYPWWIALLSLPLAIPIAAALAFALTPLTSKMVNTALWEQHKSLSPALFFALGQFLAAVLLSAIFQ